MIDKQIWVSDAFQISTSWLLDCESWNGQNSTVYLMLIQSIGACWRILPQPHQDIALYLML